jgi:signal transduction histidine kinase
MSAGEHGRGEFGAFRAEIEDAERRVAREIEPGARALVVAIGVCVLLASFILAHTGDVRGWDVLFASRGSAAAAVALPSRVFCWLALVFGVGFSMLALLTRRWALAWVALAGSAVASGVGLLAVWSRQTVAAGHPGPGVGLVVAWISVIVLTFHWARVVWSRTIVQLAAEEERRRAAARQQSRTLLEALNDPDNKLPNHNMPRERDH